MITPITNVKVINTKSRRKDNDIPLFFSFFYFYTIAAKVVIAADWISFS